MRRLAPLLLAVACAYRPPPTPAPPATVQRVLALEDRLRAFAARLAATVDCQQACSLAERICETQARLCEVVVRSGGDGDLALRCDRSLQRCREARRTCLQCRPGL